MIDRRHLLKTLGMGTLGAVSAPSQSYAAPSQVRGGIVDTNIHLFRWPFRRLPLDTTELLVEELRTLGISQAWASSFEAIFQRDIRAVNQRLVNECQPHPMLLPIGAINLNLVGWERDLTECIEDHKTPGVRLFPSYHGYALNDLRFLRLLRITAEADVFVQVATCLEDRRTQAKRLMFSDVDVLPLTGAMRQVPSARVQLLNYRPRPNEINEIESVDSIFLDTARVDSTDGAATLVKRLPQGRVMFGSHAPFLIPQATLIRAHESSRLDQRELSDLLGGNAVAFGKTGVLEGGIEQYDSLGLPSKSDLDSYQIWDSYFTPSHSHPGAEGHRGVVEDMERSLPAIRKGRIKKLCYFAHVGIGTTSDKDLERYLRENPESVLKPIQMYPDLLIAMIQLNPNDVKSSLDAIERWIADGPMKGCYFPGAGPASLTCSHKNFDPLVRRIQELGGVIMQHTWFNSLGKPSSGTPTPADLVELARRHPHQRFLCAHAGGEWEKGIRAVRAEPNILVETSGFDATAGFIEMAVRDLGAERVVFGSHLPSRSLGTEISKVIAANITEDQKRLILGENFRRLLALSTG